jgi:hypothetical protein
METFVSDRLRLEGNDNHYSSIERSNNHDSSIGGYSCSLYDVMSFTVHSTVCLSDVFGAHAFFFSVIRNLIKENIMNRQEIHVIHIEYFVF